MSAWRIGYGRRTWSWFFSTYPVVSKVVIETDDLTVYYHGIAEPFPITSLRAESQMKKDLYRLWGRGL